MAKRQKPSTRPKKPFPPVPPTVAVEVAMLDLPVRILTKKEVRVICGNISEPTLWEWVRCGFFPPARVIGPTNSFRSKQGWLSTEVYNHILNAPTRKLKEPER
jgi:predicted DNA-binding transcriptional regulator AlpA